MSIKDQIREAKKDLADQRFKKGHDLSIWKPKDFEGKIRILPLKGDDEKFYLKEVIHWSSREKGAQLYYCPSAFDDDKCPVCQLYEKCEDSASLTGVKFMEIWQELTQKRWNMRIIIRDSKEKPVLDEQGRRQWPHSFYCSQKSIQEGLLKEMELTGAFWNVNEGYDLLLEDEGKGYDVRAVREATPLFDSEERIAKVMKCALEDKEYSTEIAKLKSLATEWLEKAKSAVKKSKREY